ncbi:MAG: efflux RND transporter periplasmic adaptor subunit [Desulfotomaculaceae bacterium]|nr:efflux RND transporter periplasmic adaptor subunit [Desulfotomaculaceae bacterium]MDD4767639.1 efflux RND transporter periplasmic adaptor subunit [Desulfotomaculaceae bacterium]
MKSRYLNVMAALVIVSLLLSLSGCGNKAEQETVQADTITVETVVVENMDITKYTGYAGTVKGSDEVAVMPDLPRRVTAVYVTEGQAVQQGQVIVSLDRSKLDAAVQQAEAAVAAARAAQAANEVQKQTALDNYNRIKQLHTAAAVSDQSLEAAKAQYDALNTGAAEAGVAQAQAALSLAQQNLADCEVTSPISGIVGRVDVAVGDTASMQSPVAIINNTADLEIEVNVSEADISFIQAGTTVQVRINAISEELLTGTIKSVASVADPVTRTYPVNVSLPNNDAAQVKSGMFAEVLLGTQHRTGVLGIPMVAVLPKSGENTVFVVNEENRGQAVIVQTGLNDGIYVEITSGLQAGQRVVTKGNTLIDENSLLDFADGGLAQ